MPLEKNIEEACRQHARRQGWLLYKWSSPSQRGVPDRILFNGSVHFIEFKTPRGRVSPLQRATHERLTKLGASVHVVTSLEQFKELFGCDNLSSNK